MAEPIPESPIPTPPAKMSRIAILSAVLGGLVFLWALRLEVFEGVPWYENHWPCMPLFAISALLTSLWVFFRAARSQTGLTLTR